MSEDSRSVSKTNIEFGVSSKLIHDIALKVSIIHDNKEISRDIRPNETLIITTKKLLIIVKCEGTKNPGYTVRWAVISKKTGELIGEGMI